MSEREVDVYHLPRNQVVDIAKGIAGVFVVLGHTLAFRYHDGVLLQITHLTTPLYIFLSGVFMKINTPWRQSLWRLFDALLKPYFVVLFIWGGWHCLFGQLEWIDYFLGVLYGTGATIVLVPLWFLPHLFVCRIAGKSLLFHFHCLQKPMSCSLLVLVFWMLGLQTMDWAWAQPIAVNTWWWSWYQASSHWPGLPFSADVLLVTLACLLSGYGLSSLVQRCRFHFMLWACGASVFIAAIYAGADFDVNRRVATHQLATTAFIVSGMYMAISSAVLLARWNIASRFFSYLGRYFLLVLLLHLVFLRWIDYVVTAWLGVESHWQLVWMFGIGMLSSLLFVEVVRRSRWLSLLLLPLPRRGGVSV